MMAFNLADSTLTIGDWPYGGMSYVLRIGIRKTDESKIIERYFVTTLTTDSQMASDGGSTLMYCSTCDEIRNGKKSDDDDSDDDGTRAVVSGDNAAGCTILDIKSEDVETTGAQADKLKAAGINADNAKSVKIKSDNADFTKSVSVLIPYQGLNGKTVKMYYETATGYVEWPYGTTTVTYLFGLGDYAYVQIPQVCVNMIITVE